MPHSTYQPRPDPKQQQPHFESPYRLPTFDGSSDPYYFREWAKQLDDYFESCHIPESHQVSIAKSHLKCRALQFWARLEDHKESRGEYPTSNWRDMRRELNLKYRPSTCGQPAGSKFRSPPVHQTIGYYTLNTPTPSDRHLEHHHHPCRTNHGPYCGQDHPPISNIRVAAPPYRSSPNLDGRPSTGSSVGPISYDSPFGPTSSHPSQPLAFPVLDPASMIILKEDIKKKRFPEPETECIHFVDASDITNDEEFFEDETEVIESDSWHDLNPELGKLEPWNDDTLAHPDPSLIEDISLDKVCLDDSNGDNFKLEMRKLKLLPELNLDLSDPEFIDLRVITKPDPFEDSNVSLEDSNLNLTDSEPKLNPKHPLVLLESILGVAPSDLHLIEYTFLDWTYITDLSVRETYITDLSVTFLTVVPNSVKDTLPHFLSPIPASHSLGYPTMVVSHDPSSYHIPDSYIVPSISLSFPSKDSLFPSWMTLINYPTVARRLSVTRAETPYGDALLAKDVFIAPPTPVPLDRTHFRPPPLFL
ncbi:hypothetical protein MA16_Dca012913 [Dendrobium catenatum]|uniref:Retrotransposon gag domain-containing protein n=1 Tax=Dendrobium catenatum TaxID=906689 RepID=A0A2I0W1N5_9ASPA|nr:hypothetical protein MA16_Dca012913 [Dendrobium catenatum]